MADRSFGGVNDAAIRITMPVGPGSFRRIFVFCDDKTLTVRGEILECDGRFLKLDIQIFHAGNEQHLFHFTLKDMFHFAVGFMPQKTKPPADGL